MSCGPKIKKAQIPSKMKNQRKLKDLWSKQWNLLGRSSTGGFYVHKGLSGVFTWDTAPVLWTVEHLSAKTCRKEKVVLRSGGGKLCILNNEDYYTALCTGMTRH